MKRSYNSELRDTVDCVLVGYITGRGRRAKWGVGSLLMAVYDPENDTFPTVTKVGSGLTEEGWQEIFARIQPDIIAQADPRVRYLLQPDVWVTPRYVFELQADEVSLTRMHAAGKGVENATGYALRFPRIIRERTDEKSPEQASTVTEVSRLFSMQGKGDTRGKRKAADSPENGEE